MQKYQAICTDLGYLTEAQAFYLDEIKFDYELSRLTLKGEMKGEFCQPARPEQWLDYELSFSDISGFKFLDLDMTEEAPCEGFQEVLASDWLATMPGDSMDEQRHLIFVSNDDVIEVICHAFDLSWRIQE